jgi:hypothetical protein
LAAAALHRQPPWLMTSAVGCVWQAGTLLMFFLASCALPPFTVLGQPLETLILCGALLLSELIGFVRNRVTALSLIAAQPAALSPSVPHHCLRGHLIPREQDGTATHIPAHAWASTRVRHTHRRSRHTGERLVGSCMRVTCSMRLWRRRWRAV